MFDNDDIDDFWNDKECIAKLDAIERGLLKMTDWCNNVYAIPSFDLGMSQTNEIVNNISREYERMLQEEIDLDEDKRYGETVKVEHEMSVCEDGAIKKHNDRKEKIVGESEKKVDGNIANPPTKIKKFVKLNEVAKNKMVTRELSNLKMTKALTSPFRMRNIDATEMVEKKEEELFYWLIHAKDQDRNEIVFSYKDIPLRREETRTLQADLWINTYVIAVWSIMLNQNEAYRATDICAYNIVDMPDTCDEKRRRETFKIRLDAKIKNTGIHSLDKIDLFFFSLFKKQDYYIIFFDIKKRDAWVIDNFEEEDGIRDVRHIYEATSFNLQKVFSDYLLSTVLRAIEMMQMAWRDNKNTVGCGVYAMCHMKTYMDRGVRAWKSGLEKQNATQMKHLIMKYCATFDLICILTKHLSY